MSNFTAADFIRAELTGHAKKYASKAQSFFHNPALRECVIRGSVSSVVSALFDAYRNDQQNLQLFRDELLKQCSAIEQNLE